MRIPLEVRERLSPLQLDHINFNGRYPHDPRSGWRNAAAFDGYAFGLALQCVTELDPTDKKQCQTIGEPVDVGQGRLDGPLYRFPA